MAYLVVEYQAETVEGMQRIAPPVKSKAAEFLTDPLQVKLVEGEAGYSRDIYLVLNRMFSAHMQGVREQAMTNILLWIGPVVVFGVLTLRKRE